MRGFLAFGALAAAMVLIPGFLYWSGTDSGQPSGPATAATAEQSQADPERSQTLAQGDPPTSTPSAEPTPEPTPEPRSARGIVPVRITLPTNGIEAPVIKGDVDPERNEMVPPDSAIDVAWYDYSALPGEGGNAVFAGHVDRAGYGPAVFWRLRHAGPGDFIEVELSDGAVLKYQVEFTELYPAVGGPWGELFSPYVGEDVITLYTCEGAFENGEYDQRRVVRAVLVDDGSQQS